MGWGDTFTNETGGIGHDMVTRQRHADISRKTLNDPEGFTHASCTKAAAADVRVTVDM